MTTALSLPRRIGRHSMAAHLLDADRSLGMISPTDKLRLAA
jgi:hypothetical protein